MPSSHLILCRPLICLPPTEVHEVAENRTRLSDFTFSFHFHALEKEMATIPVFLPGEFHGQRSLVGYSPWGCEELDAKEADSRE